MLKTKEEIKAWLAQYEIKNAIIHDDLTVDVNGSVEIEYADLSELPIQFGTVKGGFSLYQSEFTTLKGCPREVEGYVNLSGNAIKNLQHCPQKIQGSLVVNHCFLETLEGCPPIIPKEFKCSYNRLTNLKGGPKEVGTNYICDNNMLISLEGSPSFIPAKFSVQNNQLVDLKGCPEVIKGMLCIVDNKITTLDYFPEEVGDASLENNEFDIVECNGLYITNNICLRFTDEKNIESLKQLVELEDSFFKDNEGMGIIIKYDNLKHILFKYQLDQELQTQNTIPKPKL